MDNDEQYSALLHAVCGCDVKVRNGYCMDSAKPCAHGRHSQTEKSAITTILVAPSSFKQASQLSQFPAK